MNAAATLKGGLIGCGFFAHNHLHGWGEVADACLIAVCDRVRSKAQGVAQRFSIKHVYDDAETMLREQNLDFVDIVTTMDNHRELVELAARYGVPAIVQKPFAPTLDDAEAMVAACRAADIWLMVHENFRWQTPLLTVREVINSGAIGTPFFGRVSFRHGNPVGYENQPYLFEQPQYIINDVGIHLLDLARFYFGEVERIYTEVQRVNQRFRGEDVATMLLRHANGATSISDLSVSTQMQPDPFAQVLVRVEGDTGSVELGQDFNLKITCNGVLETRRVAPQAYTWTQPPWDMVQESVVNIQRHWVDCLRQKKDPATSGADN